MDGQPKCQSNISSHTQYAGASYSQTFQHGYNAIQPPYFGGMTPDIVNGHFGQPLQQVPTTVQRYLDIKSNESDVNKLDKQDLSVSQSALYCQPCQKSFLDKNGLSAHLKAHVKCEFPNCSFVASRQTLKLHEIQCHREGKMKIVLDTPEKITKWREERKRNYPTATNVARKKIEREQKIESGQTAKTKEFRYNKKQGWKQRSRKGKKVESIQPRNNDSLTESAQHVQSPTNCLNNENMLNLRSKETKCQATEGKSSLGVLAAAYTSSSDEDETNSHINTERKDIKKPIQSEQCPEPEFKKQKFTECNNVHKNTKKKNFQQKSKRKHKLNFVSNHQRPTLLEMLLAPDICHERNVMLQCIRYIIRKNFFGTESKDNM